MSVLGAEGWVAADTLKHDGAQGPPVASGIVTLLLEDLGSNVIGSADGRVSLEETRIGLRMVTKIK